MTVPVMPSCSRSGRTLRIEPKPPIISYQRPTGHPPFDFAAVATIGAAITFALCESAILLGAMASARISVPIERLLLICFAALLAIGLAHAAGFIVGVRRGSQRVVVTMMAVSLGRFFSYLFIFGPWLPAVLSGNQLLTDEAAMLATVGWFAMQLLATGAGFIWLARQERGSA